MDELEGVGERATIVGGRAWLRDEGDDRDGPGGAGLVVTPTRVRLDESREDLVALGVPQYDRGGWVGEEAGLHGDRRIGDQVVVPVGVLGATAGRADDEDPLTVREVPEDRGVRPA